MKRLSALDATFLHIESRETPMHVAALLTFRLPQGAPRDFVKRVVQAYRAPQPLVRPWNLKLVRVPLSTLAPAVEEAREIDLDYHVRHTALPDPGGERELGELISHLHSQTLDRSRPLWTCHIIEGLEDNRFAIYIKIHHALTDGINGIRMISRALATSPDSYWCPPWFWRKPAPPDAASPGSSAPKRGKTPPPSLTQWPGLLAGAFRPLLRRNATSTPILRPFEAPRSALNGEVTAARRVATQQLDLARVKQLARRSGTSLNDVFLALCSSALRRHLQTTRALPDASLIAGVPVSLREAGDESGNAVGFLWATLGTHLPDPCARLMAIRESMQVSKDHLKGLPAPVRSTFTMLTMAPAIGVLASGLGARVRPPMNVTISNVPGPEQTLYLGGATLEAIYPVSLPLQGLALNITCISYAGQLNVGFTGSRDSLPHLQKVAVYAGEALDELERAVDRA